MDLKKGVRAEGINLRVNVKVVDEAIRGSDVPKESRKMEDRLSELIWSRGQQKQKKLINRKSTVGWYEEPGRG